MRRSRKREKPTSRKSMFTKRYACRWQEKRDRELHSTKCCATPVPFSCNMKLRSYYTKTCPKITYSLIQLHGVEFFCQQIQKAFTEIT